MINIMNRLKVYLVTDSEILKNKDFYKSIEESLKAGVGVIQLREKKASGKEFLEKAYKLRELTNKYNALLIINDRVDIALIVNADGVHIGQSDLNAHDVKKIMNKKMILGVSVKNIDEAKKAKEDGANYIGVGGMFKTNTKVDADIVSIDTLKEIGRKVDIPIVIIGGIKLDNIDMFVHCRVNGYAVVSAILSSDDIYKESIKWIEKTNQIKTS